MELREFCITPQSHEFHSLIFCHAVLPSASHFHNYFLKIYLNIILTSPSRPSLVAAFQHISLVKFGMHFLSPPLKLHVEPKEPCSVPNECSQCRHTLFL